MSYVVINTIDTCIGVICNTCEECITERVTQLTPEEITRIVLIHEQEGCLRGPGSA